MRLHENTNYFAPRDATLRCITSNNSTSLHTTRIASQDVTIGTCKYTETNRYKFLCNLFGLHICLSNSLSFSSLSDFSSVFSVFVVSLVSLYKPLSTHVHTLFHSLTLSLFLSLSLSLFLSCFLVCSVFTLLLE